MTTRSLMRPTNHACGECGMTNEMGTFHPYAFCRMFKAGIRDPWAEFAWMVERVTGEKLPAKPPRIRDLPLPGRKS